MVARRSWRGGGPEAGRHPPLSGVGDGAQQPRGTRSSAFEREEKSALLFSDFVLVTMVTDFVELGPCNNE